MRQPRQMGRYAGHRALPALACLAIGSAALLLVAAPAAAQAQKAKPNILVIWGDDIGGFNISAYNMGMMGYKTPNIDRIAREGALFTDWYGQQRLIRLMRIYIRAG